MFRDLLLRLLDLIGFVLRWPEDHDDDENDEGRGR